jgi:hypothetical protein
MTCINWNVFLEFTFCDRSACCNDLLLLRFFIKIYVIVIMAYAKKEKDWWNSDGLEVLCFLTNE